MLNVNCLHMNFPSLRQSVLYGCLFSAQCLHHACANGFDRSNGIEITFDLHHDAIEYFLHFHLIIEES